MANQPLVTKPITRRATLTGLAATALTTVPTLAADQPSPVAELVEDYRFACEEHNHANERAEKIRGHMQAPQPRVHVGNLLVNGGREPIYVHSHREIDRRADQIDIPEVPQWRARAARLRTLWHEGLSKAEEAYNSEATRRGLPEADDAAERAWDAKFDARDAVLTHQCQTVADFQGRDSFIRELIVTDQITDDVWDLVFDSPRDLNLQCGTTSEIHETIT